jgi:hypothetical protein
MGFGMMNEASDRGYRVKDLWIWQSETHNVSLYKVADTRPIVQNQTYRVSGFGPLAHLTDLSDHEFQALSGFINLGSSYAQS